MSESLTHRTAQEELAALIERGQAFANQVRAVTYNLDGQAYSSTVSALNQFDADLRRTRAVHAAESLPPSPQMVGSEERGIGIGMAIAAGIIMRCWGQEVYACEILTTAGFTTLDELKASGVDQFDIDALMPIFAATATEGSGE